MAISWIRISLFYNFSKFDKELIINEIDKKRLKTERIFIKKFF